MTRTTNTDDSGKLLGLPDLGLRYPDGQYDNLKCMSVMDHPMGSGKTTAAVNWLCEDILANRARWIIATERLEEVDALVQRIEGKGVRVKVTDGTLADRKQEELRSLLTGLSVQCIVITHRLLMQSALDPTVRSLVSGKGFKLLMDEVPAEIIKVYDGINTKDFLMNLERGAITLDPARHGLVQWTDAYARTLAEEGGRREFSVSGIIADEGCVHASMVGRRASIVWMPPADLFKSFHRVVVTTYQMEGTAFDAYLRIKGITWAHCADIEVSRRVSKSQFTKLIQWDDKYDRAFADLNLDATWYKSMESKCPKALDRISAALRNIADRHCKKNPESFAFTVYSGQLAPSTRAKGIKAKGYASHKYVLVKNAAGTTRKLLDRQGSCYLACNMRASNNYRHKRVMVYAINRYPEVVVSRYLKEIGVQDYNPNRVALNEMIQWVWRSAIRDGKSIHLAVFSARMRRLFKDWLDDEQQCTRPCPHVAAARANGYPALAGMETWHVEPPELFEDIDSPSLPMRRVAFRDARSMQG